MKRKNILAVAALLLTITAVSNLGNRPEVPENRSGEDKVNVTFQTGSPRSWAVLEVANNETEKEEGLMNRTELGKHEGMLFNYSRENIRGFWMKNTLIPLDMIFIDSDKEVINVETAYPEPNTSEENLEIYRSAKPAQYVIEVNAGFAENHSIKKGTKVHWER